jgi:hypothetical protein
MVVVEVLLPYKKTKTKTNGNAMARKKFLQALCPR